MYGCTKSGNTKIKQKGCERMKKITVLLLGVCMLLSGCAKSEQKEGTGTYTNANGETTTAKVTLKDGKISKVSIDETAKDKDKTKKELGADYHMKIASGIGKEWNEQVKFFENYVAKHGIEKLELKDNGKAANADVISGCTISVEGFVKAIADAKANAK